MRRSSSIEEQTVLVVGHSDETSVASLAKKRGIVCGRCRKNAGMYADAQCLQDPQQENEWLRAARSRTISIALAIAAVGCTAIPTPGVPVEPPIPAEDESTAVPPGYRYCTQLEHAAASRTTENRVASLATALGAIGAVGTAGTIGFLGAINDNHSLETGGAMFGLGLAAVPLIIGTVKLNSAGNAASRLEESAARGLRMDDDDDALRDCSKARDRWESE